MTSLIHYFETKNCALKSLSLVLCGSLLCNSFYGDDTYRIAVAGTGYVGLSNAVMLAQHHEVIAVDVVPERVKALNEGKAPFSDSELERFLAEAPLHLRATLDAYEAYSTADFVFIATPTDYDPITNYFNTTSVESVIRQVIAMNPEATIVVKSTIPIGFVERMRKEFNSNNILFCPEFLREGKALSDVLHPSRIIVGDRSEKAQIVGHLLRSESYHPDAPLLFTGPSEAEAIKLFANGYLAMRVSYFNELDSFAMTHGLSSAEIVQGVCLDPRIGNFYTNPSFGYGGYCFPKDTKQLLANYKDTPQNLIEAIVESNKTRKQFLVNAIQNCCPNVVGIHRLIMKSGSDNFRSSAILDIIQDLKSRGIQVVIYEPLFEAHDFEGCPILTDLDQFKEISDLIVANRLSSDLADVPSKVFTRDLFGNE